MIWAKATARPHHGPSLTTMATTQEEFFAEGLTNPSPPSPSVFLDLPPMLKCECQGPLSTDDTVLSYISRMLMEEDTYDKEDSDHSALLQVQQPFAQILSSPSSGTDRVDNRANTEVVKYLLQNNSGHQRAHDSGFSEGVDAVGAFLKGMDEANMFLPKDNVFRRGELVNHMVRERSNHCGCKKRRNGDEHLDEVSRASKAVMTMEPKDISGHKILNEMMLHGHEICIKGMEDLSISMATAKRNKKSVSKGMTEVVDLSTMLILCAQAVAANNHMSARELLKQIKKNSSATGDATQRLAHCFVQGLEARQVGSGSHRWQLVMAEHSSSVEFLEAYKLYLAAGCFIPAAITYFITTIVDAMKGKSKLHIVDYGPCYGFHLAGLLRVLASREGGPPEVKITAIGCPNLRPCPAERIEDTGSRLRICARKVGLPFKFHAIMMKPEKVCFEDLSTDAGEVLVVNDLFNFSTLKDDSVFFDQPSPRDTVLNNIRKMQPDVFIQSIVNYSCGTSFLSRFRGTLFYHAALFDMLDATIPRDDKLRMVLEQGLLGQAALNVIACEGTGVVERPDIYRQWQIRNQRAGLRQLPLKPHILKKLHKVKKYYHKDFLLSEDGQWLLQGWRGRVLFAHSTWVAEEASAE